MTITISINDATGINVNLGGSSYLATQVQGGFDPAVGNFGRFTVPFDGRYFTNSSQYGLAHDDSNSDGIYAEGSSFLAGGNMTYDTVTNQLSGTVDTLVFGQSGLNNVSNSGFGYSATSMSVNAPDFTISSLGLAGGTMNSVLFGLMTGNASSLQSYLATNAVIFQGNNGADAYQGGSQADTLNGGGGNDTLAGGGGNDTLAGGDANDTLTGGAGVDSLGGANGNDTFVFGVGDSTVGASDTISDFSAGTSSTTVDRIDLSALGVEFFNGSTAAELAAWFVGGVLYADTDEDDSTAEFAVTLSGVSLGNLNAGDFVFA